MTLAEFLLDRINEDRVHGRESWPGENRARWFVTVGCQKMIEANVPGVEVYERTLQQLGTRYAHHPEYRDEWLP